MGSAPVPLACRVTGTSSGLSLGRVGHGTVTQTRTQCGTTVGTASGCSWPGRVARPGQGVHGILHAGFRAARAGPNQYNGYDVTYARPVRQSQPICYRVPTDCAPGDRSRRLPTPGPEHTVTKIVCRVSELKPLPASVAITRPIS